MKILVIAPDLPYPPDNGGRIRVYQLLRHLAERHQVSLLAFDRYPDSPGRADELSRFCSRVVGVPLVPRQLRRNKRRAQLRSLFSNKPYQYLANHSHLMQQALDDLIREDQPEIVQVEFAQMGYHALPAGVPSVLDQHNVEHEILYRTYKAERPSLRKLYSLLEWVKFKRDEPRIVRKFSSCLTTSDHDRSSFASVLPLERLAVVPNGVNSTYFTNPRGPAAGNNVVFTGTINYHPNVDGLLYFLSSILPRVKAEIPDVRFHIVGKDPPPKISKYAADPGVVVTGYVEDIREHLGRAAVAVVPLRIGGGTRLKILEAMSMRCPVVSTTIGAEGIDTAPGQNILIADGPDEFARALIGTLRDEGLRGRLAENGRKLVEEKYDWRSITETLEECYARLVPGASRQGGDPTWSRTVTR